MDLMNKVFEMSKEAHEAQRKYKADLSNRDLEIESLKAEIKSHDKDRELMKVLREKVRANRDKAQQAGLLALGELSQRGDSGLLYIGESSQRGGQKAENTHKNMNAKTPPAVLERVNRMLGQMRQTTVEMLLARAETAQIFKEWSNMASLASIAVKQSSALKEWSSKAGLDGTAIPESLIWRQDSFTAMGCRHNGTALFNLRRYWEAVEAFRRAARCKGMEVKFYSEVAVCLDEAKQAQDSTPLQSPKFTFEFPSPGIKSTPSQWAPRSLQSELTVDSPFGSPSPRPSTDSESNSVISSPVQPGPTSGAEFNSFYGQQPIDASGPSSAGADLGSSQRRRSRSIARGPETRDPRRRQRSRIPVRRPSSTGVLKFSSTPHNSSPLLAQWPPASPEAAPKTRPEPTRTRSNPGKWQPPKKEQKRIPVGCGPDRDNITISTRRNTLNSSKRPPDALLRSALSNSWQRRPSETESTRAVQEMESMTSPSDMTRTKEEVQPSVDVADQDSTQGTDAETGTNPAPTTPTERSDLAEDLGPQRPSSRSKSAQDSSKPIAPILLSQPPSGTSKTRAPIAPIEQPTVVEDLVTQKTPLPPDSVQDASKPPLPIFEFKSSPSRLESPKTGPPTSLLSSPAEPPRMPESVFEPESREGSAKRLPASAKNFPPRRVFSAPGGRPKRIAKTASTEHYNGAGDPAARMQENDVAKDDDESAQKGKEPSSEGVDSANGSK